MLIIGCDFHPGFQQVAIFDKQTGEYQEKRLSHRAEAEQFYRSLAGQRVRVGMEACGHYPWMVRLCVHREIERARALGQNAKPLPRERNGASRKPETPRERYCAQFDLTWVTSL